jgi:hypothetical protein
MQKVNYQGIVFLWIVYFIKDSARTAKAPHQEKIKLLFNFFKDDEDNGIKFIDFTKMVLSILLSFTIILEIN